MPKFWAEGWSMGHSWRSPGQQGGTCSAQVMSPAGQGPSPTGSGAAGAPQNLDRFLLLGWGCSEQLPLRGLTPAPSTERVPSLDTAVGSWKTSSSCGKKAGNRSPDQVISRVSLSPCWLLFRAYHKFNCFGSF